MIRLEETWRGGLGRATKPPRIELLHLGDRHLVLRGSGEIDGSSPRTSALRSTR
jgi:hypothetical protein